MCLVLFALGAHPDLPLVILANRDEFYERPTAASGWWTEHPDVLAGRDLKGGGTWMGVTRAGRWTAVTNVRDPASVRDDARSRGHLTRRFLTSALSPEVYAARVHEHREAYNGFNLLVGDADATWLVSTRQPEPLQLGPGVYGLSNDTLDTPWPKVVQGRRDLRRLLDAPQLDREAAFGALSQAEPAPDAELPETGVGLAWERALSSAYIAMPGYGTRTQTILTRSAAGEIRWTERRRDGSETAEAFALADVGDDEPEQDGPDADDASGAPELDLA